MHVKSRVVKNRSLVDGSCVPLLVLHVVQVIEDVKLLALVVAATEHSHRQSLTTRVALVTQRVARFRVVAVMIPWVLEALQMTA